MIARPDARATPKSAYMGAMQRLQGNAGGGKIASASACRIRPLRWNLFLPRVVCETLGRGNFSEAWAPCGASIATPGGKNCGKLAGFAVCCWNLLLPPAVRGSMGAMQRFDRNAGGQKLWQVGWIRGLLLEPSSSKGGPRKFSAQDF